MLPPKKKYPTDLTDSQFELLEKILPKAKSGHGRRGRPASDLRKIINGILYINKTGCRWRMLPSEFGQWNTVHGYFNKWSKGGIWKKVMDILRKKERKRQGRNENPSAASVDSQSVKSALQKEGIGIDGGKKTKGRKRHILVDTLGLILAVLVTPANGGDRKGLQSLLEDYFSKGINRLRKIWADGGYSGSPLYEWVNNLKKTYRIDLEVTENKGKGFNLIKKRWVVERTFAWIFNFRRNSKDYENLRRNSEAMIQISMISILLRRLA